LEDSSLPDLTRIPLIVNAAKKIAPPKRQSQSTVRASFSVNHSSDQVLTGWPVRSEIAAMSRE
jgi:hypothetical protein